MTLAKSIGRFLLAYVGALAGSTVSVTAAIVAWSLVARGGGDAAGILDLLAFAAMYSVVGVTLLGPLGFLILRRERSPRPGAWMLVGTVIGAVGMLTLSAFDGFPFNPLLPVAAIASAGSAFCFWRLWNPSAVNRRGDR